ncbi:MAG: response regulator transcription factor [Cyclobacteriaceae bacterium]
MMETTAKILLVKDDESLGYILKEYLQMHDYTVIWAKDGVAGKNAFDHSNFGLCVLDVMMPHKDGFTLASEIRAVNDQVPIIFLTAKTLKVDKLKGFKIGCDDYIVKPVDEEELIARIRAIIRRNHTTAIPEDTFYQIGKFQFDAQNQSLNLDGTTHRLTEKETEILKLLCQKKGRLLDRKETLRNLWGENDYFTRRSMDVFITKLRKLLSSDPQVKIKNVHGKGFILEDG